MFTITLMRDMGRLAEGKSVGSVTGRGRIMAPNYLNHSF